MDAKDDCRGTGELSGTAERSYQLGKFRDNEDALRRLKRQAGIVTELEMDQLRAAGLRSGVRVMDLGCGPGIVAAEINRRFSPVSLVAADRNEVSLAEARRELRPQDNPNCEIIGLDVYDPVREDDPGFDFIYSRLVFQHLSRPLQALRIARERLRPDGIVCISDVDDRWLTVQPTLPEQEAFLGRVGEAQAGRGGDRRIGTRLPSLMYGAGFSNVRVRSMMLSTDLIGKEAFCDLVFGYKMEVLPVEELESAAAELGRIKLAIDGPNGWAGLSVFFVSGQA